MSINTSFSDVMSYILIEIYRLFYPEYRDGIDYTEGEVMYCTLKMEVVRSSEMMIIFSQTTPCHIKKGYSVLS